jgi:hypothetical protein
MLMSQTHDVIAIQTWARQWSAFVPTISFCQKPPPRATAKLDGGMNFTYLQMQARDFQENSPSCQWWNDPSLAGNDLLSPPRVSSPHHAHFPNLLPILRLRLLFLDGLLLHNWSCPTSPWMIKQHHYCQPPELTQPWHFIFGMKGKDLELYWGVQWKVWLVQDSNDCTVICPASKFLVPAYTVGAIEWTWSASWYLFPLFAGFCVVHNTWDGDGATREPPIWYGMNCICLMAILLLRFLCQDEKSELRFGVWWRHWRGTMSFCQQVSDRRFYLHKIPLTV